MSTAPCRVPPLVDVHALVNLTADLWPALRRGVGYEIVIIDDASPDGTQEVVRALQKEYGDDVIVRTNGLRLWPRHQSTVMLIGSSLDDWTADWADNEIAADCAATEGSARETGPGDGLPARPRIRDRRLRLHNGCRPLPSREPCSPSPYN